MKRRTFTLWYTKTPQNTKRTSRKPGSWIKKWNATKRTREKNKENRQQIQTGAAWACCAMLFSHIVWLNRKRGVYITEEYTSLTAGWCSGHLWPKRGQEIAVMGLSVGPPWACRRRVLSKPRVANGVLSEDWTLWALQRKATREAGNRAAITFRSGQWRDSVPERFAVNNSTG